MIDRDDPISIPNYFAENIENWLIRDRGKLKMRPGLTARGASPSKTYLGSGTLYRSNGIRKFVRVVDGAANTAKFQSSDDGTTWSDISGGGSKTTGKKWSLVQANDNLYGVNGTDTAFKYDGTTVTTVAAIPNGTAIEWWKNFMWVVGNSTYKDRLYFSNAADPETWGGSDYVNVNLGDNSNAIAVRGTAGSTGRLYIGKQYSVWYLTGTSSSNFAIQPLTYEHGVASQASTIAVGKNSVWCVDQEGNIRDLYRTTEDTPFSKNASEDISNAIAMINSTAISGASAVYHDNYVMFFLPYGVDTYNSIVYVYDFLCNEGKGGWLKFTNWSIGGANVFTETTNPKLFLFDSRTSNGQTYEWTGTSDNGLAITAKYDTKVYDNGFPTQEKTYKYSYQYAPALSGSSLRFYVSIDRYYYTLLKNFSLTGGGDTLWGTAVWGEDTWGSEEQIRQRIYYSDNGGAIQGTSQQIRIEAQSTSAQIEARAFTSHFLIRGLR